MRSAWIFTILLFIGVSLAITLDSKNCTLPRVRYRWGSLTTEQQQNYLRAVQELKNYQEIPYEGATYTRSLYDIFSLTHSCSVDADFAHGSDGFFVWHRNFMWKYETALQEVVTAYNYNLLNSGATTGFLDACVTVPYWDWENDYQKESTCAIFSSNTFGANTKEACVTTGYFANWAGADQKYCLYRGLDVSKNGGIACGSAQIINYIANRDTYTTYRSNIEGKPHGSVHMWIGSDIGNMGNMWSPDDPVFYLHHSNIDRLWALWQDCYDYEKLSSSKITTKIFPNSWTNSDTGETYYRNNPMPYNVDLDGGTYRSYRFPDSVTPMNMQSLGYQGPGFNGMYYRYGPDKLVTTLNSMKQYRGVCNFDTYVNYTPKQKRSLEEQSPHTAGTDHHTHSTTPGGTESEEHCLFGSKRLENEINNIERTYSHHSPSKKLYYLALWECAEENLLHDRNYSVPLRWCKMNRIDPNDWKTVCEKEGCTQGYTTAAEEENQRIITSWKEGNRYKLVANLEEQQSAMSAQGLPTWVLPVSITAGVILLLVIIIVTVVVIRKKHQSEEQY